MYSVLIADDEPAICTLINTLVDWEDLGLVNAGIVHNGHDALTKIRELHPDIVITDIQMPGLSGLELIEQSRLNGFDCSFVIVSGYHEFEYARKALELRAEDYLLKPIKKSELNRILKKVQTQLEFQHEKNHQTNMLLKHYENDVQQRFQDAVFRFFDGHTRDFSNIIQQGFPALFSDAEPHRICIGALHLDCSIDEISNESAFHSILHSFKDLITDFFSSYVCNVQSVSYGNTVFFICQNFAANSSSVWSDALQEHLAYQRLRYDPIRITLAFSSEYCCTNGPALALEEVYSYIFSRIYNGFNESISHVNRPNLHFPHTQITLSENQRKNLLNTFDTLQKDAIEAWVTNTIAYYKTMNSYYLPCVEAALDACRIAFGILNTLGLPSEKLSQEARNAFYLKIINAPSIAELTNALTSVFTSLLSSFHDYKNSLESKPIRFAKEYIQRHYMEPISLDSVANAANFAPAYFSFVFKRETGKTFSEYLTEVRIQQAKHLLSTSAYTIVEISRMVGYNDPKYFSKMFSQSEGIRPKEYRKLHNA